MKILKPVLCVLCLSTTLLLSAGCNSTSESETISQQSSSITAYQESSVVSLEESFDLESSESATFVSSVEFSEESFGTSNIESLEESSAVSKVESSEEFTFILNTSTKTIHTRKCASVKRIKAENKKEVKVSAENLTDAISKLKDMGYSEYEICKRC